MELPEKKRRKGVPMFEHGEYGLPDGQKKPTFSESIQLYREERKFEKNEVRERRARWWNKITTCFKETFPMMSEPQANAGEKLPAKHSSATASLIEFDDTQLSPLERNRRETMLNYQYGKYPPFNIEPLPHERQRLARVMSAEDRARRQEWLKAQILHPSEPMGDPFMPYNPLRRLYRAPLDRLETFLRVRNGPDQARLLRQVTANILMAIGFTYFAFYWMKYNKSAPGRRKEHYGDFGFSERKVLRND
ncbi:hypothetical protein FSP39_009251 [Pinctada imbricata]|uniref:Complex I-B17 n=1 Tax=Pinctada imbricata TaxID=66713 RepID=A0AA88XQW3_PINIB|nr:hypothetical protein FSP39_009251 [Pinctada imbricata]